MMFARLAKHPEVERTRSQLLQPAVPCDRDMVGLTQLAGDEIASEVFVNRCEQEIMIDADRDAALRGLLDERGALPGIGSHRLFQEDVQPRVDQGRCGSSMQVRREEHVDDVELGLPVPEHLLQRFVTACRPVAFAERPARAKSLSQTATSDTPGIVPRALACQSAM